MTAGATLREMRWQDIETLVGLDAELFADDAWPAATWWAELAERPRRDYVVAEVGGAIAGYGGVDLGGEVADIMSVAVVPHAQGRGLGRVLLDELEARAARDGALGILLEVRADNAAARALYSHNGYEEIHVRRKYYQPGDVDAIIMRKRFGAKA
jgi:ribosomal-protein-alanine N-acetyltransferase